MEAVSDSLLSSLSAILDAWGQEPGVAEVTRLESGGEV